MLLNNLAYIEVPDIDGLRDKLPYIIGKLYLLAENNDIFLDEKELDNLVGGDY